MCAAPHCCLTSDGPNPSILVDKFLESCRAAKMVTMGENFRTQCGLGQKSVTPFLKVQDTLM